MKEKEEELEDGGDESPTWGVGCVNLKNSYLKGSLAGCKKSGATEATEHGHTMYVKSALAGASQS